jgi:hypothetical protein
MSEQVLILRQSRRALLLATVLLVAIVGLGVYYVFGPSKCQQLEDDFLNNADAMGTFLSAREVAGSERTRNTLKGLEQLSREKMVESYLALSNECGARRAGKAMRQAKTIVLS